ncbi:MAG: hypothetical protein LW825_06320 [Candidatus Jidaibacter sp.]|nr:hypothetical protein [Candidatus Jidaibacter sp.]
MLDGTLVSNVYQLNNAMASNAQFDSYLQSNPTSSLNVFRDLYTSDLERKAGLELQKLSVNFGNLNDDQKRSFFQEVDRALSAINALRDMITDSKKQQEEELSGNKNFSKELEEQMRKEKEAQEQVKMMQSLSVAIERAAIKTAAEVKGYDSPAIGALKALDDLTNDYMASNAKLVEKLKELQKELTGKVKIIPDRESSTPDSPTVNPSNNTISQTGALLAVVGDLDNRRAICSALGVPTRAIIELSADGKEIYAQGAENGKRLPFSVIEDRFRTLEPTPQVYRNVGLIRGSQEIYANMKAYLEEAGKQLNVAKDLGTKWVAKILAERGIAFDENKVDSQIEQVARDGAEKRFVEKLQAERAAITSIDARIEEQKNAAREINAQPGMQRHNLLSDIRRGVKLRKVETNDRSASKIERTTPTPAGDFTEREAAKASQPSNGHTL